MNEAQKKFINKVNKKHNGKYDYSLIEYKNIHSIIKVICPIHGVFETTAFEHSYNKNGCPMCFSRYRDIEKVINNLKEIHNDKYDYSLVVYKTKNTKVKIICPEHGIFEQTLPSHFRGAGCPSCSGNKKMNKEDFINKAKLIHGDKYDYSLVNYINNRTKVKIICTIHGEFEQTPTNHLQGQECRLCGNIRLSKFKTTSKEDFINKAKLIHGDKYNYSEVVYDNCKEKVKIICNEHGIFEQTPDAHIQGQGCSKCATTNSQQEEELITFIESLGVNFISHDKSILNGKELDIFIPSHNIAIEYDGLYWHSEIYKPSDYHLKKTSDCESNGIRLIHIFENEWVHKKEIVKSVIKNNLGLTKNKIYARKCIIKEIGSADAKLFLNNNHIQGYTRSNIKLGLYYNNELVSVMLFNKPRKGIGIMFNGYELSRFANKMEYSIVGGASKLLKYFIKQYNPVEIISYANRRWSQGNLYEKLGFKLISINKPTYWYIFNDVIKHRLLFRKQLLIKEGYDKNKSEHDIMLERKIYRIYDCGTKTYSYKKK